MFKQKRGLLPQEVVKMVVSLIVILLLVALLAKLYFNSELKKELEQAKGSIQRLAEQIDSEAEDITFYSPDDWILLSWPYKGDNKYPDECREEKCLCICKPPGGTKVIKAALDRDVTYIDEVIDHCNEFGACKPNPGEFVVHSRGDQGPLPLIKFPLTVKIDHSNKIIE